MESITSFFTPIHREGHPFIILFGLATVVLFVLLPPVGWLGVGLTAWCTYFFRDPDRTTPVRAGLIISPADGRIQAIEKCAPPPELAMGDDERLRISVFMNVFDVHVNRTPADGTITAASYRPGKFLNATLDKASEDNERQSLRMTTSGGKDIAFVQIAGLIARRIVCNVREGDSVEAGQRFGMIRFGSRLDVYLDAGMKPLVVVGQRAIAGETVLADSKSREAARKGAVR